MKGVTKYLYPFSLSTTKKWKLEKKDDNENEKKTGKAAHAVYTLLSLFVFSFHDRKQKRANLISLFCFGN